jgi:hypothetical protein
MAHPTHQFTTMTEAYEAFSKACIPVEAGVSQRDAMKKSFFAGMVSMQSMAFELSELTEREAIKRLKAWEIEALEYTLKLVAAR